MLLPLYEHQSISITRKELDQLRADAKFLLSQFEADGKRIKELAAENEALKGRIICLENANHIETMRELTAENKALTERSSYLFRLLEQRKREQPTTFDRPWRCRKCGRGPGIDVRYYPLIHQWRVCFSCDVCLSQSLVYHREQLRAWNAAVTKWNTKFGKEPK